MARFIPSVSFTGYPDGRKTEFVAGNPARVSQGWLREAKIVEKGLGEVVRPDAAQDPQESAPDAEE